MEANVWGSGFWDCRAGGLGVEGAGVEGLGSR